MSRHGARIGGLSGVFVFLVSAVSFLFDACRALHFPLSERERDPKRRLPFARIYFLRKGTTLDVYGPLPASAYTVTCV